MKGPFGLRIDDCPQKLSRRAPSPHHSIWVTCATDRWVPLAFTAAISLGLGHLTDLGVQLLGSGPTSTAALTGNVAGMAACILSVWFGARRISRAPAC